MTDIMHGSLAELGAALRDGKTTATALADAAAENHSANSESFGAFKLWEPEVTTEQAKAADAAFKSGNDLGPLQGLPISVKDLYGVRGWPTFAGTPKAFPASWQERRPCDRFDPKPTWGADGQNPHGGVRVRGYWRKPAFGERRAIRGTQRTTVRRAVPQAALG